jgi:zinc and cadmium transporter
MDVLVWIIGSGILMSVFAGVGAVTLILKESTLEKILKPLVAFAAGSLLGGAFFHMIPAGLSESGAHLSSFVWIMAGFTVFFALEQFLHWHHCHRAAAPCKQPLTYLILIGDGLHNFIGGTAVAGVFLSDIRLGIMAWSAAAAHEVPQELGDFGVLVHGGWSKSKALIFNIVSGSSFLVGGLLAYAAAQRFDVSFLIPFAAGNFIYIGATDLVPEINKQESLASSIIHFACFLSGVALMLGVRGLFGGD